MIETNETHAEQWEIRPLPELIDHILARYHEPLREGLPPVVDAAARVERVHGDKANCPHGLADRLARLHAEIGTHLAKEEQVLFPAIRSGRRGPQVHMPVRMMMQEHEDHEANLQRIRELTSSFVPPAEACGTWRALYSGLEKLDTDFSEHIRFEKKEVLFPRLLNG